MKLSKTMEKALNEQINKELYSAYLYLSMAAYCEEINLPGFAHWMKKQAEEEVKHAMKIFEYVTYRRGRVVLENIEKPPTEWNSILEVFEETLKHEEKVTESIYNLIELAQKEKDHATVSMLKWFVDEQVEEEASADEILQRLKLIDKNKSLLYALDRELAKRQ